MTYRLIPTRSHPDGGWFLAVDATVTKQQACQMARERSVRDNVPVMVRERDAHGVFTRTVGTFPSSKRRRR